MVFEQFFSALEEYLPQVIVHIVCEYIGYACRLKLVAPKEIQFFSEVFTPEVKRTGNKLRYFKSDMEWCHKSILKVLSRSLVKSSERKLGTNAHCYPLDAGGYAFCSKTVAELLANTDLKELARTIRRIDRSIEKYDELYGESTGSSGNYARAYDRNIWFKLKKRELREEIVGELEIICEGELFAQFIPWKNRCSQKIKAQPLSAKHSIPSIPSSSTIPSISTLSSTIPSLPSPVSIPSLPSPISIPSLPPTETQRRTVWTDGKLLFVQDFSKTYRS